MERAERARTRGEHVLQGTRFRLLPFLGPAFIASVAYIDPGNFATNIAGGSQFGYTLVWVVVASSLMAMLVQGLSAKLGVATGRNLAEVCRDELPQRVTIGLWLQAEVIAMATDLAEFLGAAIGLHLLFGMALLPAAFVTAIASFGILGLQRFGFRPLEATIGVIVLVIGVCYVIELFFAQPDLGQTAKHAVVPSFAGSNESLLLVGRDHRRDRDAARDLAPLGADAGPDPSRERRAGAAADALHVDRRADRDDDRGADQRRHARHGGEHLLQERLPPRRVARGRAQDARAAARRRGERDLRAGAARVRACRAPRSGRSPARS